MANTPADPYELLRLNALVAFSDACTLPALTPTCPFYRSDESGPRCDEECRSALGELGVDRETREVAVDGGMIMTGRPMPVEVAAGYSPFDATRQLLLEQGLQIGARSTGTLLLQLRSHAATPPSTRMAPDHEFTNMLGELDRRTVPVNRVLRAIVAPSIATTLVTLLEGDSAYELPEWARAFRACRAMGPDASTAYARWFATRVEEWLARLLDGDGAGFLEWKAPPATLLASMPQPIIETEGLWIWDRFTRTSLEEWSTTSLLMEWKYLRGASSGVISPRLLGARTFDMSQIAEAALGRIADGIEPIEEPRRDLSSKNFVQQAIEHLKAGRPEKAAEIFAALTVVNPADGDALNNLGFCLLPSEPATALRVLDRAGALPSERPVINLTNRAFARHLLGQDEEALALLEQATALGDSPGAWMWVEERCGKFRIQGVDHLDEYISDLRNHIAERLNTDSAT